VSWSTVSLRRASRVSLLRGPLNASYSSPNLITPAAVHYGCAAILNKLRSEALAAAYAADPERFIRTAPRLPELPTAVWINRPAASPTEDVATSQ
jgi:putative transposase